MLDLLNRFDFSAAKGNPQILICVVGIWLLLIVSGLSSVFTQPFTGKQRVFWTTLIVCLPGLGLLIYLPFSLTENRQLLPLRFGNKN